MYLKHVLREYFSGDSTTTIRSYQAVFYQMKDYKYRANPVVQKAMKQAARFEDSE